MHGRALVVAAALLAGAMNLCALAENRPLFENGKSGYEIVIPAGNNPVAKEALDEFQLHFEKATGVKLPVVRAPSEGKPHVFIGPSEFTEKLGVAVKGLPPESLRVKTAGPDIILAGVDLAAGGKPSRMRASLHVETGTMSAVYEFLERVMGVRWYGAAELYIIVPKQEKITVPDLDITQSPAFSYRFLTYSPGDELRHITGRRWKLGNSRCIEHGHSWYKVLPPEKYGDHPEYYALVNGQRHVPKPGEASGWQVCTSNPDVVRIFAETAIRHFKDHPDQNMFSISPNDGTHFCECANCRALDVENFPEGGNNAGMPVLTDRMLTFYNAVAAAVAKQCPDKFLGAYLYSYYQRPPKRVKEIQPNLVLFRTMNSAWNCVTPERWENDCKKVTLWGDMLRTGNYLYDIYYWPKQVLSLPEPNQHLAVRRTRYWYEHGVNGAVCYAWPMWESGGPSAYLLARMMWDPKADADKLMEEYYRDLFGEAADPVRKYYDALEAAWARGLGGKEPGSAAAQCYAAGGKNEQLFATALRALEPFISQGSAILDDAAPRAKDPLSAERLKRLREQHDLMVWTVRGLAAAADIQRDPKPPREAYVRMKEAIVQRQAVVKAIRVYADDYVENYLEKEEDNLDSPMRDSSGYLAFAEAAISGKGRSRDLFPAGNFENLPAGKEWAEKNLKGYREDAGPVVEVVHEGAAHGQGALHVVLPKTSRVISFGSQFKVRGGHAYKLTLLYRTAGVPADEEKTGAVVVRVKYSVGKERAVSNRSGDVSAGLDGWTRLTHIFTIPQGVNQFNWQVLLGYPCEYWFDDIEILEMN